MKEVYFGDFRLVVVQHIKEIQEGDPDVQSTEWYLLRYLRRIERHANPPTSAYGIENSMRALLRFYVDAVEEQSDLGERCRQVFEAHRRSLRSPDT